MNGPSFIGSDCLKEYSLLSSRSYSSHPTRMTLIDIIFVIFLLVSVKFVSGEYDCAVERCWKDGPEIRFPFRLKDRQAEQCGYPGFDIYCSESYETVLEQPFRVKATINETKLRYPEVKFVVENINYSSQLLTFSKVDGCLPGLLPQLNLSASPFKFNPLTDFSLFNCSSTRIYQNFFPVPCLSSSNYHVYAADTDTGWLSNWYAFPLFSCTKMFNSSLLSYELFDQRDSIQLRWTKPSCKDCEIQGKYCRLKNKRSMHYDTECFSKPLVPGVSKKKVIGGVVIGLIVMVLVSFLVHRVNSFKKKKGDEKRIEQFLEDYKASRPNRYQSADIKYITNDFRKKLGKGGYGTVYKGKLPNDIPVAVKVLDNFRGNGEDFVNEVGTIGKIHHVNVVRLVGYCADEFMQALVYEFLPNESLGKYISSRNLCRSLGWEKLQEIAIGIAKGLDYLHQGCNQRIIHFDIKPHNILLDENFNPKVADFGLAKLCSKEQSIVSMTAARGTIGYIAPEVFSRNYGNVSYKADIYSFGMLLLDMVGGRKNFHAARNDDSEVYFPEWMYNQLEKGEEIAIQINQDEDDNKIFKKLTIAGLWCIQWHPAGRPSLKVVIQMIEGDDIPIMPPNPFASTKSPVTNASMSSQGESLSKLEVISEED